MHNRSKASLRFVRTLTSHQKKTRRVILEKTHKAGLSHLGSAFSAVDVIDAIYSFKKDQERFILSAGHSAMALYAVLEIRQLVDPVLLKDLHIHPDRSLQTRIDVSSGSLGQGLPIALGMALADRKKKIYCVITDGECAEGSIWESFRVMHDQKVSNLIVCVIANGLGAYDAISLKHLLKRIKGFGMDLIPVDGHDHAALVTQIRKPRKNPTVIFAKTTPEQFPFLTGLAAHYHVMTDDNYRQAMEMLQ